MIPMIPHQSARPGPGRSQRSALALILAFACLFGVGLPLPGHAAPGAPSPALESLLAEEKHGFPPGTGDAEKGAFYAGLSEAWTERTDALVTAAETGAAPPGGKSGSKSGTTPAAAAENAVAAGRKAVALAPKLCRAHTALAVALGKKTDYVDNSTKMALSREIHQEAEQALALRPDDELAHHILGRWNYGFATISPLLKIAARAAYGKLPDASLEKARTHLEKAVALNPKRLATHSTLALIYKQTGDKEKARQHWEAVLALPAVDAEDRAAQRDARKALGK